MRRSAGGRHAALAAVAAVGLSDRAILSPLPAFAIQELPPERTRVLNIGTTIRAICVLVVLVGNLSRLSTSWFDGS